MNKEKRPDEIAMDASKASERSDHREAERLFLTAAARASAYSNQPTMQKNVAKWDRAATRERRLAELTKGSGGGSGSTPTEKPLPDWASGNDGLTFADRPKALVSAFVRSATRLHELFTGDTSGRAWYDERNKDQWAAFADRLWAELSKLAEGK